MPKYMWIGRYTAEGTKGVLAEGGTVRKTAIDKLMASVGGTVDAVYFPVTNNGIVIIFNAPDSLAAASIGVTVAAAGSATGDIMEILTPSEMDQAVKKSPVYRPPGK